MLKPFDQSLHDQFDQAGKDWVKTFIEQTWGISVVEFGKYDIDLLAIRQGKVVGFIEVEVRDWGKDFCPYSTIHVPFRKDAILRRYEPTIFFAVCRTLTAAYWTNAERILASPVQSVMNKHVIEGEQFFDVPKDEFGYVKGTL